MLFTDISSQRAINAFEECGYLIIPRHNRLNPYTLKGIIRDAGLSDEQFKALY
jgi:hypothetical protein